MTKDKLIKILEDNEANIEKGNWNAVYESIGQKNEHHGNEDNFQIF